jgi:hypothetical protein
MNKGIKINIEIVLIAFCIVLNLLLISNPGFFSHDEFQKIDYIYKTGFMQYVKDLGVFHVGKHFGEPIRPLSFVIQGIQGLFIYDFPIVTHLIDVSLHILCVILLYRLVLKISKNKKLSFLSAVFFSVSPLALFSVGWSAALMDRLFTLFSLVVALFSYKYLNNPKNRSLIIIFASVFFGIASKETMIIVPVVVFAVIFWSQQESKIFIFNKKNIKLLATVTLPVILYLIYRLPAIISTMNGHGGAYNASIDNILPNIFIYWTYPFLINFGETSETIFSNNPVSLTAFFVHLFLLFLIFKIYGIRSSFYYLILYFIPLAPIILLASTASIYLYASATVFSVAIASLSIYSYKNRMNKPFMFFLVSLMIIATLIHSFYIQKYLYSYGVCMNKALISLESEYLHNNKNNSIVIHSDNEAPKYIIDRIVFGRMHVGKYYPVNLKSTGGDSWLNDDAVHLRFSRDCIVY